MTKATLAAAVLLKDFPADTVDPGFTFAITGTLADGTSFTASATSTDSFAEFDLEPGTYTGTVSKLGFTSQPSAPLTITAPTTIQLSVPDDAQAAMLNLPTPTV